MGSQPEDENEPIKSQKTQKTRFTFLTNKQDHLKTFDIQNKLNEAVL